MTFKELKLNPQLLNAIQDKGYTDPSPIQEKAIPSILAGQDLIGIAQTGTGKTAAYVLPILMNLKYAQGEDPRALILAPTRELSIQIEKEIESFCKYTDLRHYAVYGGTGIKPQIEVIKTGIDILVATPGRLLDINKAGALNLKKLKTIVLDEADRMMDMGFMHQINKVLELAPMKKQCLLFSATMSVFVEKLAGDFVEYPVRVEVSPQASTAETVSQVYYKVPNIKTKINLVEHLLRTDYLGDKCIIFTKTKKSADDVYKYLKRKVLDEVGVIHANKGQNTRINTINSFQENEIQILVATDVSARGIDISDVKLVINFNVPTHYEDYVHRIGRTGRAHKEGQAISLADKSEEIHLAEIEALIKMQIPESEWPEEVEMTLTPFEEKQEIDREIDRMKRKKDPSYKGAFHVSQREQRFKDAQKIKKKKKKKG